MQTEVTVFLQIAKCFIGLQSPEQRFLSLVTLSRIHFNSQNSLDSHAQTGLHVREKCLVCTVSNPFHLTVKSLAFCFASWLQKVSPFWVRSVLPSPQPVMWKSSMYNSNLPDFANLGVTCAIFYLEINMLSKNT